MPYTNSIWPNLLLVAICVEASSASSRQRSTSLHGKCTTQAHWPPGVTAFVSDLHSVSNHSVRLCLAVLQLSCRYIACKCVIDIRQVYNRQGFGIVAPKEGWPLVETFRYEGSNRRDEWHARETCGLSLDVGSQYLTAIRKIVCICRIVVDNEDVHGPVRLDFGPNWVILQSLASINQKE